jgi:hypothetical protein
MIYFIQDTRSLDIKIGYTSRPVMDRLAALQTGNAGKLEVIAVVPGEQSDEAELHRRFAASRLHGEWFRPTPDLLRHLAFVVVGRGMYHEGRETGYAVGFNEGAESAREEIPVIEIDGAWGGVPVIADQSGPTLLLKCPVCGFDYNHIGEVRPVSGYEEFPPPEGALNWAGRGRGHALEMNGECGHRWLVCFGFHKGNSYLFVTVPETQPAEASAAS